MFAIASLSCVLGILDVHDLVKRLYVFRLRLGLVSSIANLFIDIVKCLFVVSSRVIICMISKRTS